LEIKMNEKDLIKLWNSMRTQIIMAQIAPSLVLIGVFVAAAFGKFETATDGAKYLAVGVAAVTGILAIISQYAAVREGEALVADLAKVSSPSQLAKRISESRGLLSISAIAITGFGVATFALVVWAVLG
jgi:low affinity Fe/Cu permease